MTGIFNLMSYLIKTLKHQRIGLITSSSQSHAERIGGYQIGLRSFEIPYRKELVVKVQHGMEQNGYEATEKLLSLKEKPSAIFADTDLKAKGAIQAIKDAGLKVPDDISVAGFDDNPGLEEIEPALTTIRAPFFEMGAAAVELLRQKMENKLSSDKKVLKAELIIRNSCAVFSKKLGRK